MLYEVITARPIPTRNDGDMVPLVTIPTCRCSAKTSYAARGMPGSVIMKPISFRGMPLCFMLRKASRPTKEGLSNLVIQPSPASNGEMRNNFV